MLTLAYIGNGKSTNRYHIPFVLTLGTQFQIKTIYNRQINNPQWPLIEDVIYTDNINDVLDDPSIDAVIITTPASTHYDYAKQVLEKGKHCMVEKPFTEKFSHAVELIQIAQAKGLVCVPYQNRRYDSELLTFQSIIEKKLLGHLYETNFNFDTDRPEVPLNIHENNISFSYLFGLGCHALDQALYTFGLPESYSGIPLNILGKDRMNDGYSITLNYPNHKVHLNGSYFRIKARDAIIAYGTDGIFIKPERDLQEKDLKAGKKPGDKDFGIDSISDYGALITRDDNGGKIEIPYPSMVGNYANYYKDFYNAITGKYSFDISLFLKQIEILDSVYNQIL